MILGIGTDLCEVERIEQALSRFGERFATKILVASELEVFRRRRKRAPRIRGLVAERARSGAD